MSEGREPSKQTHSAQERPERVGHCRHGTHPSAIYQRAPWSEDEVERPFSGISGTNRMEWNYMEATIWINHNGRTAMSLDCGK